MLALPDYFKPNYKIDIITPEAVKRLYFLSRTSESAIWSHNDA